MVSLPTLLSAPLRYGSMHTSIHTHTNIALFADVQNLYYSAQHANVPHLDYAQLRTAVTAPQAIQTAPTPAAALAERDLPGSPVVLEHGSEHSPENRPEHETTPSPIPPLTLHAATAYVVERQGENGAYGFITKLSTLGYRVKRKTASLYHTDDRGTPHYKGDWDMGIAADMVRALPFVNTIALASGDGDFVPFVNLAQDCGVRVHIYSYKLTTHQALIDACDHYVDLATCTMLHIQP